MDMVLVYLKHPLMINQMLTLIKGWVFNLHGLPRFFCEFSGAEELDDVAVELPATMRL
jgi:hypothetical protein